MTQFQSPTPATRHQRHFEDLSPDDFERLVYWLVKRCGEFDAVQWYGGARDKGRDVIAYKHTAAGREKWYIQCKRFQSITFSTLRVELDKLAERAAEESDFAPDIIVFATACPVPPQAKDRAAAHASQVGLPEPYYWGRLELDEKLKAQPEIEEEFFGWRARFLQALHQLPADLPDFIGREKEVNDLLALLGRGGEGAAISAIGGMGGVGKSALAVHVAHRLTDRYPDAQIVVDLGGKTERPLPPAEAMAYIIHAFHPEPPLPDDFDQVAALYRSTLADQQALILLDDATNAAQVHPLLPPPPCGLIVTSRRALALPGLRSFNLDVLSEEEACELVLAIVGEGRATTAELEAIARLCGRLPLALRVAGSFLAVHPDWSTHEYVQALAGERGRLARLKHEDLDVEAALGLSAAQLAREQPDLAAQWQMLSVFPVPFGRAAAAAMWEVGEAEARDALTALAARSLLLYDAEGGLYRLHDLMRPVARNAFGYGGGEPNPAAEWQRLEEAVTRHAGYYLEVSRRANGLYLQGGEHVLEGLRQFDAAWPHLQAAYARMQERTDEAAARWRSTFPSLVAYVLDLRLPPSDRIPILEAALSAARWLGDRQDEGTHLSNLGLAYADLGDARRAIEYHEQALEIAREIGDRRGEGAQLGNLGLAYHRLGDARRAIEYHEQALEIAREIGARRGEGADLGNLGLAYAALGDARRAIEYHEQALEISREIGNRRGEGAQLGNLGLAYRHLGDARRAIEYHEQALEISREIGDQDGEGAELGSLGLAYFTLGDARRAIEYYEQALEISCEIGDQGRERVNLGSLGSAYFALGDARQAIEYHEQALEIAREIGDRGGEGADLGNLGRAYFALGDARRAIEYHEQALEIARETGARRNEGIRMGNLGSAYFALGDARRAIEYHEQALEIAREIGDRHSEGVHLGNLGGAHLALGEAPRAIEYCEQAMEIAREIGDRRGEGNHLANMGLLALQQGDTALACELWEQALRIYEAIEDPNAARVRSWLAVFGEGGEVIRG